jgi:transcription elongation factor Elf1
MSVYIDRTFLLRLAPRLQRFAKKKDDLYNFRCPLCGDSQKNKTKSRGYVYRKKNDYFYMCHNCGVSTTFFNFLRQVDESLVQEYQLERYKNNEAGNHNYTKPDFEEFKSKPIFKEKINLDSVHDLPEGHYAKTYVQSRMIPKKYHNDLYFAPDFKKFVEDMKIEKDGLKEDDPRLVIPFFDAEKNLVAFQGRSLSDSKLRYITVKVSDDNRKIFGLERANTEENICVVEGPIDSLFLNNSIATADSNLESVKDIFDRSKITLIYDNEPRNKEIVKLMEHAIDNYFRVVIWPEFIDKKDINEMVLDGFSPDEIQDIIDKNTFVNLRAKMEFMNWKKV